MLSRGCNQSGKISKHNTDPLAARTLLRRQSLVFKESKTESESCYHRCNDLWRSLSQAFFGSKSDGY